MRVAIVSICAAIAGCIVWAALVSKPADFWFYDAIRKRQKIDIASFQIDGKKGPERFADNKICNQLSDALSQCEEEDYRTRSGFNHFNQQMDYGCYVSISTSSGNVWKGYVEIIVKPCRFSFEIESADPVEPGWPTHTVEIKPEQWPQLYDFIQVFVATNSS